MSLWVHVITGLDCDGYREACRRDNIEVVNLHELWSPAVADLIADIHGGVPATRSFCSFSGYS